MNLRIRLGRPGLRFTLLRDKVSKVRVVLKNAKLKPPGGAMLNFHECRFHARKNKNFKETI